jgi:hypothetical protein
MSTYVTPAWTNGESPAIDATALLAIGNAIEQDQGNIADNALDIYNNGLAIATNTASINALAVDSANLKSGTLIFTNTSVLVGAWTASTVYPGFGYAATFACTGVTSSSAVQVYFAPTEAMNGNYAPIATAGTNIVTIYAIAVPTATITIPTVVALKHVV